MLAHLLIEKQQHIFSSESTSSIVYMYVLLSKTLIYFQAFEKTCIIKYNLLHNALEKNV